MIGFNISVHRFAGEQLRGARGDLAEIVALLPNAEMPETGNADRLAVWQSGLGGPGWLNSLVEARVVAGTRRGGFPDSYAIPAQVFLEQLRRGLPDAHEVWRIGLAVSIDWDRWPGRTTIYEDVVDQCDPEEWLLVEVWDED